MQRRRVRRLTRPRQGHARLRGPEVLERAFVEDRIVVTCNVEDFVKLARARELHAGIVLIERAGMKRQDQLAVIRAAVGLIAAKGDIVNRVLWVSPDGTMEFEGIPPP